MTVLSATPHDLGTDNMRRISNSEVTTWLACRRKYYYQFVLNLQPLKHSDALNKGVLGHEILAHYYDARIAGESHDSARDFALRKLTEVLSSNSFGMEIVLAVRKLLEGYWGYYADDADWIILACEKEYDVPISDEFCFVLRLDLLVQERRTGQTVLVDHKFVYDFWSEADLTLNPQFPKYIGALTANGIKIDKAVLNQIRTRSLKNPTPDDLFRRTISKPSSVKIRNMMIEQVDASREVVEFRELPEAQQKRKALRSINKKTCKGCPVEGLCMSELDGGDVTYMIQTDFRQNTYGYNGQDEVKVADLL